MKKSLALLALAALFIGTTSCRKKDEPKKPADPKDPKKPDAPKQPDEKPKPGGGDSGNPDITLPEE